MPGRDHDDDVYDGDGDDGDYDGDYGDDDDDDDGDDESYDQNINLTYLQGFGRVQCPLCLRR